jgi:hypothetical protein
MDAKKIREDLNKEFEWDGPPFALHALKKTLSSFMKQKCARLKRLWVKSHECEPVMSCNSQAWAKLKEY